MRINSRQRRKKKHQPSPLGGLPQQTSKPQPKKTRWGWTGFSGKTLWDWLQLLAVLAVPLAVAFGTAYFAYQQAQLSGIQHQREVEAANLQHQRDVQAADDQQQEATLQSY